MRWGLQFLKNQFHLIESNMKSRVQLNLGSLKLVSSPASLLLGPLREHGFCSLRSTIPALQEWGADSYSLREQILAP